MPIHLLNPLISGRIAAGEVVERPASIVKELMENSVDAQASTISVSIENGGLRSIRVADNGIGIAREELPLAIVKHATSKISTLDDLQSISSMGFRGEALFSIAAVSMLTLRSRARDAQIGGELFTKGGEVQHIRDAGLPDGTSVLVENLFFNTPARLKFLKKPASEAAAVSDVVLLLALAHPEISVRYTSNGSTIYHTPGDGNLLNALISIYGAAIKPRLLELHFEADAIHIDGYIGNPDLNYPRQKNGNLFVNGRAIRSPLVQAAVLRAYGERLMKGAFPFYALHISLPYTDVDVNVHPHKTTVRFRNEAALEDAVYQAVRSALQNRAFAPNISLRPAPNIDAFVSQPEKPLLDNDTATVPQDLFSAQLRQQIAEPGVLRQSIPDPSIAESKIASEQSASLFADALQQNQADTIEPEEQPASLLSDAGAYQVIGVAFQTYLIVQTAQALYLIDQHAANERMIYDTLLKQLEDRCVMQPLLCSQLISLSHEEALLLEENKAVFTRLGFSFEQFGALTYKIDAVPQILGAVKMEAIVKDALAAVAEGRRTLMLSDVARAACKRAVKAGQPLPPQDVARLVRELSTGDSIPHCPHGRPLAIALTRTELEKSFGRRV